MIEDIILYTSIIFWICPVFRQYRHGYFYYFLILAVMDPVNIFAINILKLHPYYAYLVFSCFLTLAVLWHTNRFKLWKAVILFVLTGAFIFNHYDALLGTCILHAVIFYYVLDALVKEMFFRNNINLYFIILLLYEASLLLKLGLRLIGVPSGIYYFYITSAFTILIAVYFTLYNLANSPKYQLAADA